jgi:hypothetical protein
MRPTCSIVTIGCVAFGMNWSNTESTTTRTDSDSTTGALNGSIDLIQPSPLTRRSPDSHVAYRAAVYPDDPIVDDGVFDRHYGCTQSAAYIEDATAVGNLCAFDEEAGETVAPPPQSGDVGP